MKFIIEREILLSTLLNVSKGLSQKTLQYDKIKTINEVNYE